ncbi:hypothetical protein D3C86_1290450 [compost metagenome]
MKHDSNPTTLLIGLACGCEATLHRNIADGLDMVEFRREATCKRHFAAPTLPAPVIGFGPLWTWDANLADRRALPATSVARFEREHVYKLLEGYCYLDQPGNPGYGPLAKVRWAEPAAHH